MRLKVMVTPGIVGMLDPNRCGGLGRRRLIGPTHLGKLNLKRNILSTMPFTLRYLHSTGYGCKQHWLIISFCRKMEHTKNTNSNNRKYLCSQTVISL